MFRGHHHEYRLGETLWTQVKFDEFAYFAATFSYQAYDVHVGLNVSRDHSQQGRFTHTRSSHNRHTLALSDREETIENLDSGRERLFDDRSLKGCGGQCGDGTTLSRNEIGTAIDGTTESVDHPTEKLFANLNGNGVVDESYLSAERDPVGRMKGHEEGTSVLESHDFAGAMVAYRA